MDLRRLTLHQLRVFRAVARRRSFTRAAEDLGLTQPAVSAQIRALTEILGVPVFEQLGKRVFLTDAGRTLLEHARRVENAVEELGAALEALRGGTTGRVRVGASTSIGTYWFPGVIAAFTARYPGIDVTLEIENSAHIAEGVLQGVFDVGYVGAAVGAPELHTDPLLEDEILFACAPTHPLASRPGLRLDELAGHKMFVREPGSATRAAMERELGMCGLAFGNTSQLGSVEAIKRAVMAGLGISYFSELTIRQELAERRLVRLCVEGLRVTRTFFRVMHRDKRFTPAIRAFTEFTRTRAR